MESDNQMLEEVMVVAYGTAKKSAFTGSAAVLKSEEIGKIQTSNAMSTLAGKAAGVQLSTASGQPGVSSPSIRIRGISSINAGNTPLIILDGSPFDGDMNSINTQDIESMTVLKDAASNALYGARGANGVIMITTKQGQKGDARVTLDAKWGVNSRATKTYNTINDPAQYYEVYYTGLKNMFMANGNGAAQAHYLANQNLCANNSYGLWYNVFNVPAGQAMIGSNGKLNPNATIGNLVNYNGQEYLLTPDDWLDAAYKNSLRQEYNVTISSGNQKSSFYSSFGYLKNEAIRIEYADYFYQNTMLTVIIHAQSFGTTFSFIITRPVAYGIHIPPISLPLGMRQRITIHLTGRSLKYFCFVTLRQSQHIKRAEDSRLRRFDSIMLIMYRRSGTCQIVYLVHIRPKRINYIVFYQFKARMPDQVTYILFTPREKVV